MGSKSTLKIFHCGDKSEDKAKKIEALANQNNIENLSINIENDKFTATRLLQLCNKMKLNLKDVVDTEDEFYKKNFKNAQFDEADWLRVLIENPNLIKMPIAETDVEAKIIDNPREILSLQPIGQNVDGYDHLKDK